MCENKPKVLRQNQFVTNLKNGPNKLYSKIDRVSKLVADQSGVTSQQKMKVLVDDAQDLQEILAKLDELLESMRYNFQVRHPDDAMDDQYGQPIPKRKLLSIDDTNFCITLRTILHILPIWRFMNMVVNVFVLHFKTLEEVFRRREI